jgi:striatin 1/3/4
MHHRIHSDQIPTKSPKSGKRLSSFEDSQKIQTTHRPSQSYGGFNENRFEINVPAFQQPEETVPVPKRLWAPKLSLRSHLDCVRKVKFVDNMLISASEDCLIKLWNIDTCGSESDIIEPFLTLRGHRTSVLALDAGAGSLFSADSSGMVRLWTLPESYSAETERNLGLHQWRAHTDAVWSVCFNENDSCLLTSSADGCVKLWRVPVEYRANGPQCKSFAYPGSGYIPTVCSWVPANLRYFVVGYASFITVFNVETAGFSKIPFSAEGNAHQVNCICASDISALTVAGHEDKRIRFFDLRNNSCIKDIVGHTDSISEICIDRSGFYMVSTGHDGSLRSWDLRKFHCLHEITLNRKKYDESIFCAAFSRNEEMLAIGGADSIIKILDAKGNS